MARHYKSPSWLAIICGFVFFWPAGLYLLFKKLTTDRAAAVRRDRIAPTVGWVYLFIGAIIIFGSRPSTFWVLCGWFLVLGGCLSLSTGRKGNLEGDRFRSYIDAIVNQGLVSFRDIAAYTGQGEGVVRKDLRKMVSMGYFGQAYIDENRGEIHILRRHTHAGAQGDGGQRGTAQTVTAQGGRASFGNARGNDGLGQSRDGDGWQDSGTVETMATCRN